MDILLNKSKINKTRLKSAMIKVAGNSLSGLSEPCYKPKTKKHYFEFLNLTKLKEQDIKEFTKRQWSGRKESKFKLHNDPKSNFYIFLMWYFLKQKDQIGLRTTMLFFAIRHYRALLDKHIKFCNEDIFRYALEHITRTHLFAREKTIGNAMYHISNEMLRRYTRSIAEKDIDQISKFIQECRHRISQSVKSFANAYYEAVKQGGKIKTQNEPVDDDENVFQYENMKKDERAVEEVTKKITVYQIVDKIAQENARKITKINSSIATMIVNKVNNVKHTDSIRLILKLFVRDLKNVNQVCGNDYYKYVRSLMSIKRTTSQVYFKQQVNILLMKVLADMKYQNKYNNFTSQTQFLINLFLSYYLTMIFRNSIC